MSKIIYIDHFRKNHPYRQEELPDFFFECMDYFEFLNHEVYQKDENILAEEEIVYHLFKIVSHFNAAPDKVKKKFISVAKAVHECLSKNFEIKDVK